jgi:hypothetical protein
MQVFRTLLPMAAVAFFLSGDPFAPRVQNIADQDQMLQTDHASNQGSPEMRKLPTQRDSDSQFHDSQIQRNSGSPGMPKRPTPPRQP